MVGSLDLGRWAGALGVTNDDDAIGVVEELRVRLSQIQSAAAHLHGKVSDCPGDVGSALRHVISLLGTAEDQLVEVRTGFARHERGER